MESRKVELDYFTPEGNWVGGCAFNTKRRYDQTRQITDDVSDMRLKNDLPNKFGDPDQCLLFVLIRVEDYDGFMGAPALLLPE